MNKNRRYTVEASAENATLEYRNKVYLIDDTFGGWIKFKEFLTNNEADFKEMLIAALGETAAEEIIETNPRIAEMEEIMIFIGAAYKNIDPADAKKKIQGQ